MVNSAEPSTATRRARTRIIAGSWRLPLVVLVGVLLAGALVTLYGGLNGHPATEVPRTTTGVVIGSEPCARAGARDTVRVQVDGRTERLPINACGNPSGFQLDVELLTAEDGTLTARLAGTGGQPGSDLARRISAVLLVLAGLAGAALVMQLAPGAPPAPAASTAFRAAAPRTDTGGWAGPLYPAPVPVGSSTVADTPVLWPASAPEATNPPWSADTGHPAAPGTAGAAPTGWPTSDPPVWPGSAPAGRPTSEPPTSDRSTRSGSGPAGRPTSDPPVWSGSASVAWAPRPTGTQPPVPTGTGGEARRTHPAGPPAGRASATPTDATGTRAAGPTGTRASAARPTPGRWTMGEPPAAGGAAPTWPAEEPEEPPAQRPTRRWPGLS